MIKLNSENMATAYKRASLKDRSVLWASFWNMRCLGFISKEVWKEFWGECGSLDILCNAASSCVEDFMIMEVKT